MLAIVPVKGRDGKNRLEGILQPEERARLVAAMLQDVVDACRGAAAIRDVLVVTPDSEATHVDAEIMRDDGTGHAEAVARALADDRARGGTLVVMGDCPLVTSQALDRLAGAASPLAMAPARDGGLNAVALRDPQAVAPAFGEPDAARVTLERARQAGIDASVVEDPRLAFDVDTPSDVWQLRQEGGETATHRTLAEILPPTGGLL